MLYEVVVATTFLVRRQPRRTLLGVGPRMAAYGATFLLPDLSLVGRALGTQLSHVVALSRFFA